MSGAQCHENPPTLDPAAASGTGSVEDICGVKVYVTGSSAETKKAVILVSDIFGFEAPKLRQIADKVAAAGFFVIVPDYLHGDPFVPEKQSIPDWIKAHHPQQACEETKQFITHLKDIGILWIGIAGFCWGGKVVAMSTKSDEFQAAVMLHPSRVTVDEIKEITTHIAILGAEIDQTTPPALVKEFEDILSSRTEIKSFVKIYSGVSHGWTVRYRDDDEVAAKKAEEAHADMIDWFIKNANES